MGARFQSVLQDLKEQYGATAADLTPGEIEALVFACARVDSPFTEINAELMERPVPVCPGVWLWPVTAGAAVWLEECAAQWWRRGTAMYRWAQVYALRNARDPDAFTRLDTKARARWAVMRCALSLACHAGELAAAVNRAYGVLPHDAPRRETRADRRKKADFAALVARLEAASGIPARTWLWGRSVTSLMKSYVELSQLAAAALGGGREDASIELDEAVENLARVMAAIGERLGAR